MFEIQLLFLGHVKPTNSIYFTTSVFPSRDAVNVFHFALKKQCSFLDDNTAPQSAARKRSRKYRLTLQNTSSGNMKIFQLHF